MSFEEGEENTNEVQHSLVWAEVQSLVLCARGRAQREEAPEKKQEGERVSLCLLMNCVSDVSFPEENPYERHELSFYSSVAC